MITSARLIDPALSAFPRSPRTASTPGGTGKNSCRRPAEVVDVDHPPEEVRAAFTALRQWRRTGERPKPELLMGTEPPLPPSNPRLPAR